MRRGARLSDAATIVAGSSWKRAASWADSRLHACEHLGGLQRPGISLESHDYHLELSTNSSARLFFI